MIRAVDAQLVIPMTMTMTISVSRIPKTSVVAEPTTSRMIGVRMSARTNVGRTRKKSVMRISIAVDPAADEAATIPRTAPSDDRHDRRQQPDDHRDPGAVDGQVEHVAAELVGPEQVSSRDGGSRRGQPVAVDRRLERPDEERPGRARGR